MKTVEQIHQRDTTAKIIDELIRIGSFGALVSAGILAPGVLIGLKNRSTLSIPSSITANKKEKFAGYSTT